MSTFSAIEWFLDDPSRMVGVGALCTAAWLLGMNAWAHRTAARARLWPSALATITRSSIQTERATMTRGTVGATVFMAEVEYDFEVDGAVYANDTITPGGVVGTSNRDTAQEWIDRFPAGAHVPVYYNPLNPRDCFLVCENDGAWLLLLIAGVFGFIGFLALVT